MIRSIFTLILLLTFCISGLQAQDRKLGIEPDTVLINGDTLIMLGDSLILKEPVKKTFWETGGNFNVSIQQVSLSNWSGGGASSFALNTGVNLFANYKKEGKIWETKLSVNYGFNRQADRAYKVRKTNDNFKFVSKYGRELSRGFYISTQIEARTQLLGGHKYFTPSGSERETRSLISEFLSPGYIQSSTGLNFEEELDNVKISAILSPFTGRFTIVLNDSLSQAGAFGISTGEKVRPEAGASFGSAVEAEILENIKWKTDLNLFSNYGKFGNMVVNFNSIISMKVNKYISTRIETTLIYDENVYIEMDDGSKSRAVQLQNLINFGLGVEF
ncbi:DUF3078 domain-containing protein [Echinicola jeungdonensis]|uniref:DUF3078 domain-containing protein n=1 Tax=Echinicola jeungdonensis TaxID=709343 RepID=A0ABV5J9N8_9BACT|nr:DUF3078 domain-containing protein [Echinicola jeungdonensis]MDN3669937.1 DUF3078 domain-containing protein [Echinicola jeungdonensis]